MNPLLKISQLSKNYKDAVAVDGITLEISQGICFGLLGPNGAGKTTTVEMLEGIKTPSAGAIFYKGRPLNERFRLEAGIMFQNTALQEFITVRETITLFQGLYPNPAEIAPLVEQCVLQEFLDRDTRKISGGQRQRLLLALALINNPEIIFLDEPTTGLDPQARRNFWQLINSIKGQGKTIILTTHYMEEAYFLCDEIAIMDHGKIIAQGTPKSLLEAHYNDVVLELPSSAVDTAALDTSTFVLVEKSESIELLTNNVNATINALLAANASLSQLQIRPRTLEDLFLLLTGSELRT